MSSRTTSETVCGYHGCYLRVDLTRGTSARVALDPAVLRRFLGGAGLGAYLLLAEKIDRTDALDPDSAIAFVFSPLVGTPLTTSAKFAVVSKSPLTNRFNDSLASSGFAVAGKRTGCDAILVTGRAPQRSVLLIDEGEVRIEPADDLWGLTCRSAEAALRNRYGPGYQSAVIGPAGERLVRFASISHDGRHAGRGGSGAVLGSKNIKALLVNGNCRTASAAPEQLVEYARELSRRSFGPATAKYRELGTASNLLLFNRLHALPTRNFQQGSFSAAEQLAPESFASTRQKVRASCVACTIGCEHIYQLQSKDAGGDPQGVRIEYESLFALGSLCSVDDIEVVLRAARLCDDYGLDSVSAGATIAFAMECQQRGLIQQDWLRFGDGESLLRAIDLIAVRQGIGDQLAEGSRRLATQVGGGSQAFAPHVKGLELPGYEPRALQTMALGLAVGTRGADHNRSGAYEADFSTEVDRRKLTPLSAERAIKTEDQAAVLDSLILCKFLRGVFDDLLTESARMLGLVTGWDVTRSELEQTARRIVTAKKLFNVRAGWTPAEDILPERFLTTALPEDARARLTQDELMSAVTRYNRLRGWTDDGYLGAKHLKQLQLADL